MKAVRATTRRLDPRKLELGKIHAAATKLGLIRPGDDSAYRDMLYTLTRQRSAKGLDSYGRQIVLQHLESRGARFEAPRGARARYVKGTPAALIRWIWTCLWRAGQVRDDSDAALWRYCKAELERTHKLSAQELPAALQFLGAAECRTLIEHLKSWCERAEVQWR